MGGGGVNYPKSKHQAKMLMREFPDFSHTAFFKQLVVTVFIVFASIYGSVVPLFRLSFHRLSVLNTQSLHFQYKTILAPC